MPFRAEHQNPVQDLCEVNTRVARSDNESNFDSVYVTLGVFSSEIPHDDYQMIVFLKKVLLSLDVAGVEVVPGSKLGMANKPVVEQEIIRETFQERQAETGMSGASSANASSSLKDASINFGAKTEASTKKLENSSNKISVKSSATFMRVRAKNRNNWEVREENGATLDDHYLNDDELCRISKNGGANQRSVSITVYAKQQDIKIQAECGRLKRIMKQANDRNLFRILVGKALHRASSAASFKGIISLSYSECIDED